MNELIHDYLFSTQGLSYEIYKTIMSQQPYNS